MDDSIKMFPFEYIMDHESLEIHCGQLLIRRIKYGDIEQIEEGFSLVAANWCNMMPFRYLTLTLKKGLMRKVVINPPEPLEFMTELLQRQKTRQSIETRRVASA